MTTKALVVEDDPGFVNEVSCILETLDHKHDVAVCFNEAKRLIAENDYDYYLVDLEIPTQPDGSPRIQNGAHVIEAIGQRHGPAGPPVLVVTGHGRDTPALAARAMQLGAVDYITKPLSKSGNTLDHAIRSAMQRQTIRRRLAQQVLRRDPLSKSTPFQGGEMVFREDCVTLCGVKITSGRRYGYSIAILEALSEIDPAENYIRLSGEELAARIDSLADLNAVTSYVYNLRRTIAERFAKETPPIQCKPDDVIVRTGQGYYLHDWIDVRDARTCPTIRSEPASQAAPTAKLNNRQHWILKQLSEGIRLQHGDVEAKFKLSRKTAWRDLSELRRAGLIVFERKANPGYYRVRAG